MSGYDDKTDVQLLSELLAVARRSPPERRHMVRKLYGIAGGANAKGLSEEVELFRKLARVIAGMDRPPVLQQAERVARWERCNWHDLGELLRILGYLAPPAGMTVADLYYEVSSYLERNDEHNHSRRFRAWASRGEPIPRDPYGCDRFIYGEWLAVPPGKGGDHAA